MTLLLAAAFLGHAAYAAERVPISRFDAHGLERWKVRDLQKETRYQLVECGRQMVVEAVSDDSASVLYRSVDVDLEATPWLHWSWTVTDPLPIHDERTKVGDDIAARLYLGFAGRFAFLGRHSLSYVWSTSERVGDVWDNPFPPDIRYLAARRGPPYGQWFKEKRNVLEDYRRIYDKDPRSIREFGIMTDSDRYRRGLRAAARYADIYFSSSPAADGPPPDCDPDTSTAVKAT